MTLPCVTNGTWSEAHYSDSRYQNFWKTLIGTWKRYHSTLKEKDVVYLLDVVKWTAPDALDQVHFTGRDFWLLETKQEKSEPC